MTNPAINIATTVIMATILITAAFQLNFCCWLLRAISLEKNKKNNNSSAKVQFFLHISKNYITFAWILIKINR